MSNTKSVVLANSTLETGMESRRAALLSKYGLLACKHFLYVPLFPLAGHYMLDQSGLSQWLMAVGIIPAQILGEGFGHVGLCFSIHYLFTGCKALWKALQLLMSR